MAILATQFIVPTRDQFIEALSKLWPGLSEAELSMLKHHYLAHNRTTTATVLGEAARFPNDPTSTANLQYGALGHKIGDALGMTTYPRFEKSGKPIYTCAIARILENDSADPGVWMMVMHHNFADALRYLTSWDEGK